MRRVLVLLAISAVFAMTKNAMADAIPYSPAGTALTALPSPFLSVRQVSNI